MRKCRICKRLSHCPKRQGIKEYREITKAQAETWACDKGFHMAIVSVDMEQAIHMHSGISGRLLNPGEYLFQVR